MSHKDAVHNDPFVCLIRRLNPDKKVVMRRPASLLSVEKNGGRGKRRARSECEFYFYFFSKSDQPVSNHSHARSECEFYFYFFSKFNQHIPKHSVSNQFDQLYSSSIANLIKLFFILQEYDS